MGLKSKWEHLKGGLADPAPSTRGERRVTNPRATELFAIEDRVGLQRDNERLQAELAAERQSRPLRRLDPARIRPSRYANREEGAYHTPEFAELKESIRVAGGNEVPIEVRPVADDPAADFEIVYGHRRHRACQELGLQVSAIVNADLDDRAVYVANTRENSQRNDLTPWEWGQHYRNGLAEHFSSAADLAAACGMSTTHVSRALALTELPPEVLLVFPDRSQLQLKWGAALRQALDKARPAVLRTAAELAQLAQPLPPAEAYQRLMMSARRARDQKAAGPSRIEVSFGQHRAVIQQEGRGTVVKFAGRKLSEEQIQRLRDLLERFLAG